MVFARSEMICLHCMQADGLFCRPSNRLLYSSALDKERVFQIMVARAAN